MHSNECPKEHNVRGYNHGPSMNAPPCKLFVWQKSSLDLLELRRAELAGLESEASEG
jgi:hypothetical protein